MAEDSGGAGGGTATAPSAPAGPAAPKAEEPVAQPEKTTPTGEGSSATATEAAPADGSGEPAAPQDAVEDGAHDAASSSDRGQAREQSGTSDADGEKSELAQAVQGKVQEVTPPERLRTVGDEVRNISGTATTARDQGEQATTAIGQAWNDSAGEATRNRADSVTTEADTLDKEATALADYTNAAAAHVDDGIQRREAVVSSNDMPYQLSHLLPDADRNVARGQIEAATVRDVNREDEITAAGIRSLEVGQGPAQLPQPPEGATREQIEEHWNELAREQPELVGNQDGVPAVARDTANRIVLGLERDALVAERDGLVAEREQVGRGPRNDPEYGELSDEILDLDGKIDALNELQERLGGVSPDGERYYLLGVDGDDDGRFIVANGDPDRADNVATFVPGMMTDLDNFEGVLKTADAIAEEARASGESVSSIAWFDYDAPDWFSDAASGSYAEDAKDELAGFQQGLRDSHEGAPSHNTLIGHSYGSTVAGTTARDYRDLPVDDFISVSSPGLGVDHASELNLPPGRVWATEADNDLVADLGSAPLGLAPHGTDPTASGFGSEFFRTDPGPPQEADYSDTGSHDRYIRGEVPNPGLRNIGDIVAGNQPTER
ncbi:alpha/beta hydrolase family protein [Saccharothrix sp. AJ9571]|nr:alpha/beta hydrolase family protein [Saccharothrix sp. AJ9571]